LDRLLKCKDKPYLLKLGPKLETFFCCLDCEHITKRQPFISRHFPTCASNHNKKIDELYKLYKDGVKDTIDIAPVATTVVEGYTEEKVFALLGSVLAYIHNCERELYEYKTKYEYLEEKIKDVCNEEVQEDIEESLPEYPEDEDVDFCKPEDITQLFNISQKIGIRIHNDTIKDAYEKWSKAPLKKKKC
jgi:hypothetical protein